MNLIIEIKNKMQYRLRKIDNGRKYICAKVKNNYYERINIRYIIYSEQIVRKNSCAAPYVQNENNFVFIVYVVFVSS